VLVSAILRVGAAATACLVVAGSTLAGPASAAPANIAARGPERMPTSAM